jgi:hypothetical protein
MTNLNRIVRYIQIFVPLALIMIPRGALTLIFLFSLIFKFAYDILLGFCNIVHEWLPRPARYWTYDSNGKRIFILPSENR